MATALGHSLCRVAAHAQDFEFGLRPARYVAPTKKVFFFFCLGFQGLGF